MSNVCERRANWRKGNKFTDTQEMHLDLKNDALIQNKEYQDNWVLLALKADNT